MQLVSLSGHKLHARRLEASDQAAPGMRFDLGLNAIDTLLPNGLARGAIHEVLTPPEQPPGTTFALLLARRAATDEKAIVWCDPGRELCPPAVAAAGVPLARLLVLRTRTPAEEHWATVECLRCTGVGATITPVTRISRVEARRLQLAAEAGGGVGILLRSCDRHASIYAAATRWLIEPVHGERTVQRWKVQLIHGHGGRIGESVYLEYGRESDHVRAIEELARGSDATPGREAAG